MLKPGRFTNAIRVWAPRGILSTCNYMAWAPLYCVADRAELVGTYVFYHFIKDLALQITDGIDLTCITSFEMSIQAADTNHLTTDVA